jgi:hypothetical protein
VVSNEARNGVILYTHGNQPILLLHTETDRSDHSLSVFQMPFVGVPASPWMWVKARSERGALIRLCGDGVVSNEARNGVIILYTHGSQPLPLHTETDRSDPPLSVFHMPSVGFSPRHGCGRRPEANEVY